MIKVKLNKRDKNWRIPVTAKFDSYETFSLLLSFARDGIIDHLINLSHENKESIEKYEKMLKAIELHQDQIFDHSYKEFQIEF